MYQIRNKDGKYGQKRGITKWEMRIVYGAMLVAIFVLAFNYVWVAGEPVKAVNQHAPKAVAEEVPVGISVAELEQKLIDIVWHEESRKYVPGDDVLAVYDPSRSMREACTKQFHRELDCLSFGPMQVKIGTLQHYWPKLYGVELTEREALDVALGLETSQRFFVDCSVQIKGCAWNWTGAMNNGTEVQVLVDLIREAKGIEL